MVGSPMVHFFGGHVWLTPPFRVALNVS